MPSRISEYALAPLLMGLLALSSCSAVNPLCGSSRPVPVLTAIHPASVTEAEVQETFILNASGSQFVAASVLVINSKPVATTVTSSTAIKAVIGPANLGAAGAYSVWVNTPAGNSGDLGCDSGGSSTQTSLTVQ
jgi:hypothetical protein